MLPNLGPLNINQLRAQGSAGSGHARAHFYFDEQGRATGLTAEGQSYLSKHPRNMAVEISNANDRNKRINARLARHSPPAIERLDPGAPGYQQHDSGTIRGGGPLAGYTPTPADLRRRAALVADYRAHPERYQTTSIA